MNFNNPFYNPYAQRLSAMEQMQSFQPQPIQTVNTTAQPQSMSYFVGSSDELSKLNLQPNVYYIGLNTSAKEIYVRRLNNDGNIEVETYVLSSGVQEKTELKAIAESLERIEKLLPLSQQTPTKEMTDDLSSTTGN